MKQKTDLPQGILNLLVLKTLRPRPAYGWDISQRIRQVSRNVLRVNHGPLYPTPHRLETQGSISSGLVLQNT
jgi:PadR family transcriptional regulator PadR